MLCLIFKLSLNSMLWFILNSFCRRHFGTMLLKKPQNQLNSYYRLLSAILSTNQCPCLRCVLCIPWRSFFPPTPYPSLPLPLPVCVFALLIPMLKHAPLFIMINLLILLYSSATVKDPASFKWRSPRREGTPQGMGSCDGLSPSPHAQHVSQISVLKYNDWRLQEHPD